MRKPVQAAMGGFRFAYFKTFKAIGAHIPPDGAMIEKPYAHQGKLKVV